MRHRNLSGNRSKPNKVLKDLLNDFLLATCVPDRPKRGKSVRLAIDCVFDTTRHMRRMYAIFTLACANHADFRGIYAVATVFHALNTGPDGYWPVPGMCIA